MLALNDLHRDRPATTCPSPVSRWLTAWVGLAALGVGNGVLRELTYEPHVGESAGHQISTFTLLALIAGYVWWLQRRWPLMSDEQAWRIGVSWAALTLAFEFGVGHYVNGVSWDTLLADYDLMAGRLWILVPLGILIAPTLARRVRRGGGSS